MLDLSGRSQCILLLTGLFCWWFCLHNLHAVVKWYSLPTALKVAYCWTPTIWSIGLHVEYVISLGDDVVCEQEELAATVLTVAALGLNRKRLPIPGIRQSYYTPAVGGEPHPSDLNSARWPWDMMIIELAGNHQRHIPLAFPGRFVCFVMRWLCMRYEKLWTGLISGISEWEFSNILFWMDWNLMETLFEH